MLRMNMDHFVLVIQVVQPLPNIKVSHIWFPFIAEVVALVLEVVRELGAAQAQSRVNMSISMMKQNHFLLN